MIGEGLELSRVSREPADNGQITAAAESAPGATNHEHADRSITFGLVDGLVDRLKHRQVGGVELHWPVQYERCDALVDLQVRRRQVRLRLGRFPGFERHVAGFG